MPSQPTPHHRAVAPLTLVVGDEEFLVSRALEDLRHAVLAEDPDTEVHEIQAALVDAVELVQLLSPSLFGGRRLLLLQSAQDLPSALSGYGAAVADRCRPGLHGGCPAPRWRQGQGGTRPARMASRR